MRKLFVAFFLISNIPNLFSQGLTHSDQIDSLLNYEFKTSKDWAIGISIIEIGTMPIFDSLGNMKPFPPFGTYLFTKIGDDFKFRKISEDLAYFDMERSFSFLKSNFSLTLHDVGYTIDSIRQAQNEWIYPFVYKDDSLGTYGVLSQSSHGFYYVLYYKEGKSSVYVKSLTETEFVNYHRFFKFTNLNYSYNISTFIYRSFLTIKDLVEKHYTSLEE